MGTSDATLCLGSRMRSTIVSLLTTFESSLSNIIGAIRIIGTTVFPSRISRRSDLFSYRLTVIRRFARYLLTVIRYLAVQYPSDKDSLTSDQNAGAFRDRLNVIRY